MAAAHQALLEHDPPVVRSTPRGSEYGQLMKQVQAAGLLDRSALGYVPRIAVLAAMAAMGGLAFALLGSSWWQMLVAVWAAVLSAQLGFLGHDAGHHQVFRDRRPNVRFGTWVSGLGIGLSYGWWVDKHTRHHQHPNDTSVDPDVGRGVLAWSAEQAQGRPPLLRFVARHQAALFAVLLTFEALHLHINSIRSVVAAPRRRWLEGVLLVVHDLTYGGLLIWWLSPWQAVAFVAVHQGLFGLYLGASFAPNHKGMHMPAPGEKLDFLRRQVLTSRNVTGGRLLSAVLGGLDHQIEHHLFPSMPSRNLARCRPLVRAFCRLHDVPYQEVGLLRSYAVGLRFLGGVARRVPAGGSSARG